MYQSKEEKIPTPIEKFGCLLVKLFTYKNINWFPFAITLIFDICIGVISYDSQFIALILGASTIISFLLGEWTVFLIKYNHSKEQMEDVTILLDKFSKSSPLVVKTLESINRDMEFREKTRNENDKIFHQFLSDLKYGNFLTSHFVFNSDDDLSIKKIPYYYFTPTIWEELVKKSTYYYSQQLLTNESINMYLESKSRLESEINFLEKKLKQEHSKLDNFSKIFVLPGDLLGYEEKKIKCDKVAEYLLEWFKVFKDNKNVHLKIINERQARNYIGSNLSDIGIFGDNVLGIQSVKSSATEFTIDVIFEFKLNKELIYEKKKDFQTLLEKSINLSEFFDSNNIHKT